MSHSHPRSLDQGLGTLDFHLWGILVTGRAVSMEDMPETPRARAEGR